MNVPLKLDEVMADKISRVIRTTFDPDNESDIEITSMAVDQDEQVIRIELSITTTERPEVLAERYFKITGNVREALGPDWFGYFPVITPQIIPGARA